MRALCVLLTFILCAPSCWSEEYGGTSKAEQPIGRDGSVHIILDGDKGGVCVKDGLALQKELATIKFPAGWRIAIMCTPIRWDTILREADVRNTDAAFTRISERITIVNRAIFHNSPPNYRHILAHELAHILCNCPDEAKVERIAHDIEKIQQK